MDKKWIAKWIISRQFEGLSPINVFHKQMADYKAAEHKEDLKNHHMLVRRKFTLQQPFEKVCLDITADDYYKLYVNGRFAGQGPASGYFFHYNYNRIDLSDFLVQGENVIAVHVYYQGLVNRAWNSGDYRQGMIAELFADGRLCLCTDETWKCSTAKEFTSRRTTGYDTQFIEDIDERLKEKAWRGTDFDDSGWESAIIKPDDDHELVKQETPLVDVYEIKPAVVKRLGGFEYLLDFGHEITGSLKFNAAGKAGDKIFIKYGEELDEDSGRVKYEMRCNCSYCDTWILSGNEDTLEQYDYKAFRYVEVSAPDGVADTESFCAEVRHYPMEDRSCHFISSDKIINDIWGICKNAVRCGSQEAYLDCPSREKGQYLGDATISAHSHLYLSGDLRLFKKALRDFALSACICPGLMAVAPGSFMQEIADYSLQWPLQLLNYYWKSGDMEFLKEMYPTAKGILEYFSKYKRQDGLLVNVIEKRNLVDWPENLRDDYDFDLSELVGEGCHNVINAFYCGAVKTVNEIEDILGLEPTEDYKSIAEAFNAVFYRTETRLYADSEVSDHSSLHANIIPLFFGFAPDDAKSSIAGLIKRKGLNCGVYNSYFLLKGLAGIGEYRLIYELLTSGDEHSWVNMLREGATSCFEAWGKKQKWNTSLCHPWASSPVPVIIEDLIGLRPKKPGWKEYTCEPHLPEGLEFELRIQTVNGIIEVNSTAQ